MKYLALILVVTMSACAPLATAGIGAATMLAIETNHESVSEFGDKYLKAE